jgi:hypothetical protein
MVFLIVSESIGRRLYDGCNGARIASLYAFRKTLGGVAC